MDPNEKESCLGRASKYFSTGASLFREGNYDDAIMAWTECLSLREASLGRYNTDTARAFVWIAHCYNRMGNFDKAIEFYYPCLRIWRYLNSNRDIPAISQRLKQAFEAKGRSEAQVKKYMSCLSTSVEREKEADSHCKKGNITEAFEKYLESMEAEMASIENDTTLKYLRQKVSSILADALIVSLDHGRGTIIGIKSNSSNKWIEIASIAKCNKTLTDVQGQLPPQKVDRLH